MPKGKKDKKSKKQKKKELEEKRRLEEELLREQQEEERKRQEELERQRREEEERQRLLREKRRKEELLRLEKETEEDIDLIEKRQIDLNKFIHEQYEQLQWKKHLKCDPLPDISNERESNDFLTQWKEYNVYQDIENNSDHHDDTNQFDINHIKYYIKDIENGYKLLQILQDVIFDAIQQNDQEKFNQAKNRYIEMGEIGQHKLDIFTQKCLKHDFFTSVADAGMKEDGDVMKYWMEKNIKFGLWASSMSNAFKNSKIEYESPILIKLELPKQVAMKSKMPLSCRVIQHIHNFYRYFNKGVKYECIGPIIDIQLLKLPPPPRNIYGMKSEETQNTNTNNNLSGGWMVQNVTEESDKPIIWEYANNDVPDPKSAETVSLSFMIPNHIVISDPDNITLGWWDSKNAEWKIDDFKDINYDKDKRMVSCITCHLSPICMIQERGRYYEYADWKLTPSGVERCKISLITKCKLNIDIEIIGGQCKLLKPKIPELQHMEQKSLKPHQLIRLLKSSGINLCYKNDENISEKLLKKNREIEDVAHLEIASIAALFQISMSKWNRIVDDNENIIIFRLRKPLTPNEEADLMKNEEDGVNINGDVDNFDGGDNNNGDIDMWQTVMVNSEKCTFIDCNEKSKKVNLDTPIRELSHKTLLRCLTSYCTEDNTRDLQNTSFRFKETIRRMLNLLNIFRV